LHCLQLFRQLPVPNVLQPWFILPWSFSLLESLAFFLPCQPVGRRFDFPRSSVPSTVSPGLAHCETSCPSSPRFRSRVFSTPQRLPSSPELRGYVSRRNRSWDPPFRAFPSQRSRAPLEAALLPCGHPPVCRTSRHRALLPPVSPHARAFDAVAWIPQRL
jgi:hypothetical protein